MVVLIYVEPIYSRSAVEPHTHHFPFLLLLPDSPLVSSLSLLPPSLSHLSLPLPRSPSPPEEIQLEGDSAPSSVGADRTKVNSLVIGQTVSSLWTDDQRWAGGGPHTRSPLGPHRHPPARPAYAARTHRLALAPPAFPLRHGRLGEAARNARVLQTVADSSPSRAPTGTPSNRVVHVSHGDGAGRSRGAAPRVTHSVGTGGSSCPSPLKASASPSVSWGDNSSGVQGVWTPASQGPWLTHPSDPRVCTLLSPGVSGEKPLCTQTCSLNTGHTFTRQLPSCQGTAPTRGTVTPSDLCLPKAFKPRGLGGRWKLVLKAPPRGGPWRHTC